MLCPPSLALHLLGLDLLKQNVAAAAAAAVDDDDDDEVVLWLCLMAQQADSLPALHKSNQL